MTPNVETAYCVGAPQDNLTALLLHIVVLDHWPWSIPVRLVVAWASAIALHGRGVAAGGCVAAPRGPRFNRSFGQRHPCLMGYAGVAKLSVPDCFLVKAWVRHRKWDLVRIVILLRWCPVVHHRLWSMISGLILSIAAIGVVHHFLVLSLCWPWYSFLLKFDLCFKDSILIDLIFTDLKRLETPIYLNHYFLR